MSTILIIDDNALVRNLLRCLLETIAPGGTIIEAGDGQEGLEKARQHRPALVIVDGKMPHLCGNQVAAQMRAAPVTRHAYIIGLTGEGPDTPLVSGMRAHCDTILFKPCNSGQIIQACFNGLQHALPAGTGELASG
ncbi:MAG: two-component system response regulator [Anaerolineae bacterium]